MQDILYDNKVVEYSATCESLDNKFHYYSLKNTYENN